MKRIVAAKYPCNIGGCISDWPGGEIAMKA